MGRRVHHVLGLQIGFSRLCTVLGGGAKGGSKTEIRF